MKINNRLIDLLICIDTFENLRIVEDMSVVAELASNFDLSHDVTLDAILVNESKTRYYPVLDGVVMLHRFLLCDQNYKKI